MQLLHTQGFMTSSSQNLSNPFGNLLTSFQVKADMGKFSALSQPHLMNLPLINGASMSSHTKPVTLIEFCYLQSGDPLLAEPNQLSDIWDHFVL